MTQKKTTPVKQINDVGSTRIERGPAAPDKILIFGDQVDRSFSDALAQTIKDPNGNVDDEINWPSWSDEVARRVANDLGLRVEYVRVTFHKTDEITGAPFEDSNWVRIQLNAGSDARNILMVDPTPED